LAWPCVVCTCKGGLDCNLDLEAVLQASRERGPLLVRECLCKEGESRQLLGEIKAAGHDRVGILACSHEVFSGLEDSTDLPQARMFNLKEPVAWAAGDRDLATKHVLQRLPGWLAWVDQAVREPLRAQPVSRSVVVIGDDACAGTCVEELRTMGYEVVQLPPYAPTGSTEGVVDAHEAEVVAVSGAVGDFTVRTRHFGTIRTAAVLVSCSPVTPESEVLSPEASEWTLTLREVRRALDDPADPRPAEWRASNKPVVITLGLARGGGSPFVTMEALRVAQELTAIGIPVIVAFQQMRVAEYGAESEYDKARELGVKFVRYGSTAPSFSMKGGRPAVACRDEDLSRGSEGFIWELEPAALLFEPGFEPSSATLGIGRLLGVPSGPDGFLMPDNVHYWTALSNRRGVFVMGGSRQVLSGAEQVSQGRAAASEVNSLLSPGWVDSYPERVELNRAQCRRCMNCLRSCPHRAIHEEDGYPVLAPEACLACGVCTASCPAYAIVRVNFDRPSLGRLRDGVACIPGRVVVYACENSGAEALMAPGGWGLPLPDSIQVVTLPCTGYLTETMLLDPLDQGAAGVLVLACERENCRHLTGNVSALAKVARVERMLHEVGAAQRVALARAAPNMGRRARELIVRFVQEVAETSGVGGGLAGFENARAGR
jgi:coenzyme F420-reducing hydrogenase delta subunit/ferredoxin